MDSFKKHQKFMAFEAWAAAECSAAQDVLNETLWLHTIQERIAFKRLLKRGNKRSSIHFHSALERF